MVERRFAHPVLDAPALGDAPVPVRLLGDEFVLWRDAALTHRPATGCRLPARDCCCFTGPSVCPC